MRTIPAILSLFCLHPLQCVLWSCIIYMVDRVMVVQSESIHYSASLPNLLWTQYIKLSQKSISIYHILTLHGHNISHCQKHVPVRVNTISCCSQGELFPTLLNPIYHTNWFLLQSWSIYCNILQIRGVPTFAVAIHCHLSICVQASWAEYMGAGLLGTVALLHN